MIYADLKTDVAANLHRSDITATLYNNWAQRVQLFLRRRLRSSANLTRATVSASNGVIALPADFAEARAVLNPDGWALRPAGPDDWNRYSDFTGKARIYLVSDSIYTAPLSDGDFTLVYYKQPDTLDDDADTVPTGLEDVYLNAMLAEACLWTQDVALGAVYAERAAQAVVDLNKRHAHEQQPVAFSPYDLTIPGSAQ